MEDLKARFATVYEAAYTDLVRFAARRVGHDVAEDIAAEAFTIAWRRVSDLPAEIGEARAWLFGITRNLLLAQYRRDARTFGVQMGDPHPADAAVPGHDDDVAAALDLEAAWRCLSEVHQEALSLAVWDGLTSSQAAAVLGISPVAYRIRLSRARKALRNLLDVSPPRPERPLVQEGRQS